AVTWPYPNIALQQVAAQECGIFDPYGQGSCPMTSASTGFFPLYGARGTELLQLFMRQRIQWMSQDGRNYVVMAWQLLPEHRLRPDGKAWVDTEGLQGGRWPLLAGAQ